MTTTIEDVADIDSVSAQTTRDELKALIEAESAGRDIGGLVLLSPNQSGQIVLPADIDYSRPVLVDGHIALIQPDYSVYVLLGAAERNIQLRLEDTQVTVPSPRATDYATPESEWNEIGDVEAVEVPNSIAGPDASMSSGAEQQVFVNDPLVGIPWHPLLPPTEYVFPWRDEWELHGSRAGPANIHIDPLYPDGEALVILDETDAEVSFRLADYYTVTAEAGAVAEEFATFTVELNGLPEGASASAGELTPQPDGTLTFTFSGSYSEFEALVITFPTDFSTQSRIDAPTGILDGTITATSILGDNVTVPLTVEVRQEDDITLEGPGALALAETDAPVDFRPSDALQPAATDIDGSEHITGVTFSMSDLPPGTQVSYDGGTTYVDVNGSINFSGSLAEYEDIVVRLPTDFSTQNPPSTLTGSVSATTNEDGVISGDFDVALAYELDVDLSAPAVLESAEDSFDGDGSGVRLDLGIEVQATDDDGSEDSTYVEITYQDAPPGMAFNGGTYDPDTGVWTGSMEEARALEMTLPGDYSGTITSTIRAISPEGETETTQTIEVAPTGDIDFDVNDVTRTETDAPIIVNPSAVWNVAISDFDPGEPHEVLENVTLTLEGVPSAVVDSPGIMWLGVPDSTITYDAASGTLVFSGTGAQYNALRLVFPKDFSTENRSDGFANGPITGAISATSNEDETGGQDIPFSLTINSEGDVAIDDSMPYDNLVEDQQQDGSAYPILPSDLLAPRETDIDGSEPLSELILVVEGLPATDENGDPLADPIDGSYLSLAVDPNAEVVFEVAADGSVTMTITLNADAIGGDVIEAYNAISFAVPPDFSTANRSDLTNGDKSLPLNFTLTARGAEEPDSTIDPFASSTDGLEQKSRELVIEFEEDIDLAAPEQIEVPEDGGPLSQDGTTIRLGQFAVTADDIAAGNTGIEIVIGDIDGSETDVPGSDFSAVVTIAFSRALPDGTTFSSNGADVTDSYDPATLTWTGTVDEANWLVMDFAPDVNGTVESTITVTTLEGQEVTNQTLRIEPTPDAMVVGDVVTTETDAPLEILFSDYLQFTDPDSNETVESATVTIPGLPAGTTTNVGPDAISGPDGDGLYTFTYNYPGDAIAPGDVTLTFPQDFSTDSTVNPPPGEFTADVHLVINPNTGEPNVEADSTFTITIHDEGDPLVEDGTIALAETDAPVTFKPSDTGSGGVLPEATDIDGSESIVSIDLTFNDFPDGTRYAITTGTPVEGDFAALPAGGLTGISLADYQDLTIELPTDYSTESPAADPLPSITITATTDEGDETTNTDTGTLTISLTAEGDLPEIDDFTRELAENDPPDVDDSDDTTTAPIQFKIAESLEAPEPSDADGSESIEIVRIDVSGLPDGAMLSLDNAVTFEPITNGTRDFTLEEYNQMVIRLPDDFSTGDTDITGTVTFITDEDQDWDTDTPEDGQTTSNFAITVTPEADIAITTEDITQVEDYVTDPPDGDGQTIPLNIDVAVVDIDGSETLQTVTLTFDGLPTNGDTILSDGTNTYTLDPANNTIEFTGTAADIALLNQLAIETLPTHFSGRIVVTVDAVSDEGDPASASFNVDITPDAEPVIELSVADNPAVTEIDNGDADVDNFIVKEDNSFVLTFDASTPDQDGSESLTQIVIENIPEGWAGADGDVSGLLTSTTDIASATLSGTTITIILAAGVTSVSAGITLTPLENDDRDVATLLDGGEITATVTSVDDADSIPDTDTDTASDIVDMDVDAVIDPASGTADAVNSTENIEGRRNVSLNFTDIALSDNDGSEVITTMGLTIGVDTASDDFDPANTDDMALIVPSGNEGFITIDGPSDNGNETVTYQITRPDGVSDADFTTALESLQLSFPQHFSGVADISGTLDWTETTTPDIYPGDVENDDTDNSSNGSFTTTVTVAAVAEAQLESNVFVLNDNEVASDSPTSVDASVKDNTVSISDILTLLESTDDGSSDAGQVQLFVGISASTPDDDGSEQLGTVVISNIPTAWIAAHVDPGTGDVSRDAFFARDGLTAISDEQWNKVDIANYDSGTGVLTLTFVGDETSFDGALQLTPSLYEDYDVNRSEDYPENTGFTADGDFWDADLTVEVTTVDNTTNTAGSELTDDGTASAEFDVDVDPVNNFADIAPPENGVEGEIDAAEGTWQFSLDPIKNDTDESEQVTAVVLRNVPNFMTVYVRSDVNDPDSPMVPALISTIGRVPDPETGLIYNVWSLESNQWEDIELRNIPEHFSGNAVGSVDIVTTETDGGGTRVTSLNVDLYIEPTTDGGDPSENAETFEDTAVKVLIDGNLIDNSNNSPGSPEAIQYPITLTILNGDEFADQGPIFYDGDPGNGGTKIVPEADGSYILTEEQVQNLWILPRQDSNETLTLDVEVTYYETTDPPVPPDNEPIYSELVTNTGTITIDVTGIADPADLGAQEDDPTVAGSSIDEGDVNADFTGGTGYDFTKLYGYAGYYGGAGFALDQRLSDATLQTALPDTRDDSIFDTADPLTGVMTEIQDADGFDGSETLYFIIDGVPEGAFLIGAQQIDDAGSTYLVTESQLGSITFLAPDVSEVTFYDLMLYGIVYENDQEIIELTGDNITENLDAIDTQPGGSVTEQPFTVVVLPDPEGDDLDCSPIDAPDLTFVGPDSTLEDEGIVLKPTLTPGGDYETLNDLFNLPPDAEGDPRSGSVTVSISLPSGATISSDPPGAVYLDPTTGQWVIDIAKLGVDPSDPTTTLGTITITPPPHQSSPANPFNPADTIGPNDTYDSLNDIQFSMTVNNVGCGTITTTPSSFDINIIPVADGPVITFSGDNTVKEDTEYDLGLALDNSVMDVAGGMDGGEILIGDVTITISSEAGGGTLFLADGTEVIADSTDATSSTFTVSPDDLAGLKLLPPENFGGDYMTIEVTATTEDINGDTASNTASKQIYVDAVADIPTVVIDDSQGDPDTGLPYIEVSNGTPLLQIIEDIPFNTFPAVQIFSPDQDGSEAVSITINMQDNYDQGLRLVGPSGSGFVDNGDGTYTISESAFEDVSIYLLPEHARTPDEINTGIPDQFELTLSIQSLETDFINGLEDQSDNTADFEQDFVIRVRPDADVPTLTAFEATPDTGVEDDPDGVILTLSGTTPDPHEEMRFEITLPAEGGTIYLDGVALTPDGDGVVTIPSSGTGGPGVFFTPIGTVTYVPPEDFGGDVSLSAVAVSIDSTAPESLYLDEEPSEPVQLDLTITPTADLEFSVDNDAVALTETDDALVYTPSNDITVDVTDTDGSEVAEVTYTLTGVPDGTTWTSDAGSGTATGGTLTYTGTGDDFETLTITFPADFATNDTPISGTVDVTTNEGGTGSGSFTIDIEGELDVEVTLAQDPIVVTNAPGREVVEFGIDAAIVPTDTNEWETLEEVVIDFSQALPAGTTAPEGGTLNDERTQLTLQRNGMDPVAFAAMVAALSVSIPLDLAEDFTATITVTTNHGEATPVPVEVQFVDPVEGFSTFAMASPAAASTLPEGEPATMSFTVDEQPEPEDPAPADDEVQVLDVQQDDASQTPRTEITRDADDPTIARGTEGDDVVIVDNSDSFDGIEMFELLGGDDLIDLSVADRGFAVDGGAGNDTIIGSAYADTLTGGEGADTFVVAGLTMTDVITDYEGPDSEGGGDKIDLSALVQLAEDGDLSDHVGYDNGSGSLNVDGDEVAQVASVDGGFADQVQVIFEDASGQQASAIV
ncbi:hypothetical protein [Qingshengfaniella alkalisoli]|uniref:Uncharacterized protein n=1 Tax=Qingshengfaniella alkalisoli TaxID=2599296 RepID=A0A5B8ID77_9RHOB|nr:hypothetical protein [Qingshengfaniella alkalisoli]QDY71616.1 hypothetical protein FPZ52_18280 [Qingshengfaniella alkalisoli]